MPKAKSISAQGKTSSAALHPRLHRSAIATASPIPSGDPTCHSIVTSFGSSLRHKHASCKSRAKAGHGPDHPEQLGRLIRFGEELPARR